MYIQIYIFLLCLVFVSHKIQVIYFFIISYFLLLLFYNQSVFCIFFLYFSISKSPIREMYALARSTVCVSFLKIYSLHNFHPRLVHTPLPYFSSNPYISILLLVFLQILLSISFIQILFNILV